MYIFDLIKIYFQFCSKVQIILTIQFYPGIQNNQGVGEAKSALVRLPERWNYLLSLTMSY